MIRVTQMKMPLSHTQGELKRKLAKTLKVSENDIKEYKIRKRSIDARKKPEVFWVYTLDATVAEEGEILKKVYSNNIMSTNEPEYRFPPRGNEALHHPPVVIGSGPSGLFCAYALARMGYAPVVIERGKEVSARKQDVELFWKENRLNPESNVQFGEGGAGTFSDGKLNTLVKDVAGRSRMVLETFIQYGAPENIAYDSKPHIGTDILIHVIRNMREAIIEMGGVFLFETCLVGFEWEKNHVAGVRLRRTGGGNGNDEEFLIQTEVAVLAIGHSARDTFQMLQDQGFSMEAKAFAVGLRVEHPQDFINEHQYGFQAMKLLPAAPYKLTAKLTNGRGAYSFCMCPGGYVVNASSEPGRLAVNGMSYSGRKGDNANSAIIITVNPQDFGGEGPLSGVEFQRRLEEKAWKLGGGLIPQQLFGDFERGRVSSAYGTYESCTKGGRALAPLHQLFTEEMRASFAEGMHRFGRIIQTFDRYDCILSGVESRTSSPVKIPRNQEFLSNKQGVYPCGEGAGYAGGIMSAAMDGLKVAEAVIRKFYI